MKFYYVIKIEARTKTTKIIKHWQTYQEEPQGDAAGVLALLVEQHSESDPVRVCESVYVCRVYV